jgi:hypothetical protein
MSENFLLPLKTLVTIEKLENNFFDFYRKNVVYNSNGDIKSKKISNIISESSRITGGYKTDNCVVSKFLCETLIVRRVLHTRNSISYITLRKWRSELKSYQIFALRVLKLAKSKHLSDFIAQEIVSNLKSIFGNIDFVCVVPIPCGHSSPQACFSVLVATAVSRILNIPMVQALGLERMSGSSHPRANIGRKPMRLVRSISGHVLLIDDVATSGRHIEEAAQLLRSSNVSLFALSWIGGTAH